MFLLNLIIFNTLFCLKINCSDVESSPSGSSSYSHRSSPSSITRSQPPSPLESKISSDLTSMKSIIGRAIEENDINTLLTLKQQFIDLEPQEINWKLAKENFSTSSYGLLFLDSRDKTDKDRVGAMLFYPHLPNLWRTTSDFFKEPGCAVALAISSQFSPSLESLKYLQDVLRAHFITNNNQEYYKFMRLLTELYDAKSQELGTIDSPNTNLDLGIIYEEGLNALNAKDKDTAIIKFQTALEMRSMEAAYQLALIYKNNPEQESYYLNLSNKLGYAYGFKKMAAKIKYKNPQKAVSLLKKAIEISDREAYRMLQKWLSEKEFKIKNQILINELEEKKYLLGENEKMLNILLEAISTLPASVSK